MPSRKGRIDKSQMEAERRLRRQIANSNERRRMESINAGFNSLRELFPTKEGVKLSKSVLLQKALDYIIQLRGEISNTVHNIQPKKEIQDDEEPRSSNCSGTACSTPPLPGVGTPELFSSQQSDNTSLQSSTLSISNGIFSPQASDSPSDCDPLTPDLKYDPASLQAPGTELDVESPQSPGLPSDTDALLKPPFAKRRKPSNSVYDCLGSTGEYEDKDEEIKWLKQENDALLLELEREKRYRQQLEEHFDDAMKETIRKWHVQKETTGISEILPTCASREVVEENPGCYTIKNNLESIAEAIRHLEGDHLFFDDFLDSKSSSSPTFTLESTSSLSSSDSELTYSQ